MKRSANNGDAAEGVSPAAGTGGGEGESQRSKHPPLNESLQHVIGAQLKAAYDEVVKQPVPDKFLELLSALEGKQGSRS